MLVLFNVPDAVNLLKAASNPGEATAGTSAFDNFGDLKPGYSLQAGEWNSRPGDSPYIVIAIGDDKGRVRLTILRYLPTRNRKDLLKPSNWKEVGSLAGNAPVAFRGATLAFAATGSTRQATYALVKGRFTKVP